LAELFAMCEEDGFIPRYYVDGPQDKVDRTLQDLQMYTKNLVEEETNLSSMIESAMKQIEKDKEKEAETDADAANDDDLLEAELFAEKPTLTD
jgi:septal ring factor EnvC (AmiA/AmiB activator)